MTKRVTGRTRDLVILLDKFIYVLARHWLFAVNWAVAIYVGLPILAPTLMANGHERLAALIYRVYGPPQCHQLPERSYFLYGPQYWYTLEALRKLVGDNVGAGFIGNAQLGFKVAICQRCVAIYLTILIAGVAFSFVRHRLRPLHWKQAALFFLPLAVDGIGQLFGLWDSTWLSRTVSGVLAGIGGVLLVYPFIERSMREVQDTVAKQLRLTQVGSGGTGPSRERSQESERESAEEQQEEELGKARGDQQRQ